MYKMYTQSAVLVVLVIQVNVKYFDKILIWVIGLSFEGVHCRYLKAAFVRYTTPVHIKDLNLFTFSIVVFNNLFEQNTCIEILK